MSEGEHCVLEGFTFGHTGALHSEVGAVHFEVSRGLFKTEARSCGVFQEEHSHDFVREVGKFFTL